PPAAARQGAVRPFVVRPGSPRPMRVVATDLLGAPPSGRHADDSITRPTPAASSEPGTFGRRAAAAALDLILVSAVQTLAVGPAVLYWRAREAGADLAFAGVLLAVGGGAVAGIFGIAYYVYYWGMRGATPGKRLLGLAVQGEDGSEPVGLTRAGVRLFGYLVSAALLGAGFVMVAFGSQGLHDRIAGTRVVRRGRD
ncbi:MAG TPA: RDD family protein, partial [Vicinamibacteria bacterium]|nr:RDD family protein [Vicinamibacteria bacterium]